MIPVRDVAVVVLIALGASLAVSALGAMLLRVLRTRSTGTQLVVVVCTALGAVLAGATGTAAAMFLSGHDLQVLGVVAVVAGAVGLAAAVLLGRAVMAAGAAVEAAAAGLSDAPYVPVAGPLPAELAVLDRQLLLTSTRLHDARRREQAADRSRRDLVAGLSHDLRTPLAGVRAMADALADGVTDDPGSVARYAEDIRAATVRLTRMVDELFDLSRIQAGALLLQEQEHALSDLVSDAVADVRPVAQAAGVRLERLGAASPRVLASPDHLGRALTELLANAVRHTPAGGVVRVETREHDGAAELLVGDGCGGIAPADLERLFDAGFSRPPADSPHSGGLGLAVARGIVEAHHGALAVSNGARGCLGLVRLPLAGGP